MSNSLCRIGSQNSGQIHEKNSGRVTHRESIYKTEFNRFRISESSNVLLPRRKSFQCSRPLMDGIIRPQKEASKTNRFESWGSCNNLKDRSDVVLEFVDEKFFKGEKTQKWIKKAVDVSLFMTLAAADELQRSYELSLGADNVRDVLKSLMYAKSEKMKLLTLHNSWSLKNLTETGERHVVTAGRFLALPLIDHFKMLRVLKSRKSVIETVQWKLEHEGYDGLLMWLIMSGEETLTVDLLPQLSKGLQRRRDERTGAMSPMLALMVIPSVLSLLSSRYEDYMSKALDYVEAFLCEIAPPRCLLYDSHMQELRDLLVLLNTDSHKLLQCHHETCFKIQNCLQLIQQTTTV